VVSNEEEIMVNNKSENNLPGSDTGEGLTPVTLAAGGGPGALTPNYTKPDKIKDKNVDKNVVNGNNSEHQLASPGKKNGLPGNPTSNSKTNVSDRRPAPTPGISGVSTRGNTQKKLLQHLHPPYVPKNRLAKNHLLQITILGYKEFCELPIQFNYYEPTLPGESKKQKMSRRLTECKNLKDWIAKQAQAKNITIEAEDEQEEELIDLMEDASNDHQYPVPNNTPSIVQTLEKENQSLKLQIEELRKEKEHAEERESALKAKLDSYSKQHAIDKQQKESMQDKLSALSKENSEMHIKITELTKSISPKMNETSDQLAKITKKLGEERTASSELRQQLKATELEVKELRHASTTMQREMAEKEANMAAKTLHLETRIRELQKPADTQNANNSISADTNTYLQHEIEKVVTRTIENILPKIMGELRAQQDTHPVEPILDDHEPLRLRDEPQNRGPQESIQQRRRRKRNSKQGTITPPPEARKKIEARGRKHNNELRLNIMQEEWNGPNDEIQTADSIGTAASLFTHGRTPARESAPNNNADWVTVARKGRQRTQKAIATTNSLNGPKADLTKMLILPAAGEKVPETMRKNKVLPRMYGVKNIVEFSSGAILVSLEKSKKEDMLKKLAEIGLTTKSQSTTPKYEWKLHGVPKDYPPEEICEDILAATGIMPNEVIIVNYGGDKAQDKVLAIVKGDKALFEAIKGRITIQIEYVRCRIDTEPNLMKCQTCKLFGHTKNRCSGVPSGVLEKFKEEGGCMDCHAYNYNISKSKLPRSRCRPTDHVQASKTCPTRAHLKKKYILSLQRAEKERPHEGSSTKEHD
jgi:hypothetical protein